MQHESAQVCARSTDVGKCACAAPFPMRMPIELDSRPEPVRVFACVFFLHLFFFEKTMEYDVCVESVKTQPFPREKLISPILQVCLIPRFFRKQKPKAKKNGNLKAKQEYASRARV